MRRLLVPSLAALVLAGCGAPSSDADATVKEGSGVATNPSGKPRNDAEAAQATAMQQQGNAMNAQRIKDAEAIKAAMAKTGGK